MKPLLAPAWMKVTLVKNFPPIATTSRAGQTFSSQRGSPSCLLEAEEGMRWS